MPRLCHIAVRMHLVAAGLCCVTGCRGFGLIGVVPTEPIIEPDAGHADSAPPPAADGGETDGSCVPMSLTLERQRLDLLMVLDASATLYPWWTQLRDELGQFLAEDASRGMAVGLQLCADSCDAAQYVTPVVPVLPLPDNLSALTSAIPDDPSATTSTIPALTGALRYASDRARDHRASRVATLLITDATPGACDALAGDYTTSAERAASAGPQNDPAIPVYVLGFGALLSVGAIATAGGTDAELVSVTPAQGEIVSALERIRRDAQPCAFTWPTTARAAPGARISIRMPDGSELGYPVASARSVCDGDADAFYVEDASADFPLIACPHICAALAASDPLMAANPCSAP